MLVSLYKKFSDVVYKNYRNMCHLDLDLESNQQTPGRDITPMEMKGGTTEDGA